MKNKLLIGLSELSKKELHTVNGGWGGGGSWSIAYRSHALNDFFRGVKDGLSSMWK